ncbi:MAG: hypothetical protein MUP14_07200 [Dehalococcoidia bacterium]|nr:hypothetical protein [Dehalococcoidia bacterium]
MRNSRQIGLLVTSAAIPALVLIVLACTHGAGSSQAQQNGMHNCPQAGKWAISIWDGPDGTETGEALATCGAGIVDFAYYLDPETNGWLGYFDGRPELTNLLTLDNMQGIIAHGAMAPPPPTPTPEPTPSPLESSMHNCPQAGKWAISMWGGADGTETGEALATCGEGTVDSAYYLDPETNGWLGYFQGRPEITNLLTLDNVQGIIAHGAAGVPPSTATPTPASTPAPTPTPTPHATPTSQATATPEATPTPEPTATPGADFTRIIFLHHSTGANLIEQGEVRQRLTGLGYEFYDHGYNADGLTLADGTPAGRDFDVPGDNTDPDGLAVIFAQPLHDPPDNTFSHLMEYDVIAFKSCFPASNIQSGEQLADYESYYLSIRSRMDQYPNKIFIVITPPPEIPAETDAQAAARARAFSNWLASNEYVSGHPNVFTFNFFDLLADPSTNMLRANYQTGGDAHPNALANQTIGPLFADFIDQSVSTYTGG